MKRLIIIVEGQTKEEFVRDLLAPYFHKKGIYSISATKIATSAKSKGGFVNYAHLRNDIMRRVQEPNCIVTTMLDYFRIPTTLPDYAICQTKGSTDAIIDCLQQQMTKDIDKNNFIPYIQKHEFEALLFSSNTGFEKYFPKIKDKTKEIIHEYATPEEINSGAETAPSKRIKHLASTYNKVVDGNILALEIGIETMLHQCPRFNRWVQHLLAITQPL